MKKTLKGFLHFSTSKYTPGYEVWPLKKADSDGLIFVKEIDVDVEVPDDFDPRPAQIAALQEKQKQAAAAFQAHTTETMRKINELQAFEMTI